MSFILTSSYHNRDTPDDEACPFLSGHNMHLIAVVKVVPAAMGQLPLSGYARHRCSFSQFKEGMFILFLPTSVALLVIVAALFPLGC